MNCQINGGILCQEEMEQVRWEPVRAPVRQAHGRLAAAWAEAAGRAWAAAVDKVWAAPGKVWDAALRRDSGQVAWADLPWGPAGIAFARNAAKPLRISREFPASRPSARPAGPR